MKNNDYGNKIKIKICPRCGEQGLENLKTHSHCLNCDYSQVRLTAHECLERSYNEAVLLEKELEDMEQEKCPIIKLRKNKKIKQVG